MEVVASLMMIAKMRVEEFHGKHTKHVGGKNTTADRKSRCPAVLLVVECTTFLVQCKRPQHTSAPTPLINKLDRIVPSLHR